MVSKLKNGGKLLGFLCLLCCLLLLASSILLPKNNSEDSGMIDSRANGFLAEPKDTIDVLFVGDSECYSAFIPLHIWEDTGISSYVCATSAQRLTYSYEFLKEAFKNQSPKVVILETNAIFRSISFTDVVDITAEELFPVFRYHNRWKSLNKDDFDTEPTYTYFSETKGYKYNTKNRGSADTSQYMKASTEKQTIPPKCKLYLKRIAKLCKKNGAELILVSTPSTKNWNSKRHNAVASSAEDLGITYLDLNTQGNINIDWSTDTRDKGDHLNYFGASKVTNYISSYLKDTKLFTDKRKDSNYESWNTAAKTFDEKTAKAKPKKVDDSKGGSKGGSKDSTKDNAKDSSKGTSHKDGSATESTAKAAA